MRNTNQKSVSTSCIIPSPRLVSLGLICLLVAAPLYGQNPRSETKVSNLGKVKRLATSESALDLDLKMWRFVPLSPNGVIFVSLQSNAASSGNFSLEVYETTFPNINFRNNTSKWVHVEESRGFSTSLCSVAVANEAITCQIPLRAAAQVAIMYDFINLSGMDYDVTVVQTGWPVMTVEGKYARGSVFNVLSNQDQQPNPILIGAVNPASGTIMVIEGGNTSNNRGKLGVSPMSGTQYPQGGQDVMGMSASGVSSGNHSLATVNLYSASRMGLGNQFTHGSHFGGTMQSDPCRYHQMSNSIGGGMCYTVNHTGSGGLTINSDIINIRRNSSIDDKGFFQYIEITSNTNSRYGIDLIDNDGTTCTSITPDELRDDASFPSGFVVSKLCATDPNVVTTNFAIVGPVAAFTPYRFNFPFSLGGVVTRGITIRNLTAIGGSFSVTIVWTEVPGTP